MEEILKSAAHTHLLFIGACVAILVFLVSVHPNKKYSNALTGITDAQEIFSEKLPKILEEIINNNDELEEIHDLVKTTAIKYKIKSSISEHNNLNKIFISEIEGMPKTPRFRRDWSPDVYDIYQFFVASHALLIVIPDKTQLVEELSNILAEKGENGLVLLQYKFFLSEEENLIPEKKIRISLYGELGTERGISREIIEFQIDGTVRNIVSDLRKHPLIVNEIKKSKVNIINFMDLLPSDTEMWGMISESKTPEAKKYLDQKIEAGRGKVELLGISINGRIVQFGGPIALFAIALYLLMLIGELVRCVKAHESIPYYPWFALFPDLLSRITVCITLQILPTLAGLGVMWVFREENFSGLFVSLCLSSATIILNWQSTKQIRLAQSFRKTLEKHS